MNLSDCFVIRFRLVKQSYEIDVFIRYWDIQTQNLRVHYWGLEFLGHTTNHDLLNEIENIISMLTMKKLKQLLIDCTKVKWKFLSDLSPCSQ